MRSLFFYSGFRYGKPGENAVILSLCKTAEYFYRNVLLPFGGNIFRHNTLSLSGTTLLF